jgi:hypothetical protein
VPGCNPRCLQPRARSIAEAADLRQQGDSKIFLRNFTSRYETIPGSERIYEQVSSP